MTTVEVVGSGPAVEAVVAALDEDTVRRADEPLASDADLAVVAARPGSDRFETASERARGLGRPWVAVELGGLGGVPVVDATVAGFGPDTGCYHCLSGRVRANVDESAGPVEAPDASTQRFVGAVAGRRVSQALAGETTLAGTVVELPYTERRFLPLPGCICGQGRSWTLTGEAREHDREALARAEGGLDERVGVVREVGEVESFPAPYYLAAATDTTRFSDVPAGQQAAGVAVDWDTAFMKALGESYERYAAGVYRAADLGQGTADTVADAVAPDAFVRPADRDHPGDVQWLPGEHLGTGERVNLPAETVLYPPPSQDVRPPTTSGLGLGSTETEALLSGLYEVVERDANMLSWYSTFEPMGLAVDDERFDTLRRRAGAEGLDVTALLLTQDIDVPVVAVAVERDTWPQFALGSSAALDPQAAAVGALEEALQNWMELDTMGQQAAADAEGAIGHYGARPDALGPFTDPETTVPLSSVGPDTVGTEADELDELVERVTDAGLDPYATRLTTRDVEQLGFEAVRVVAPTAQPLFFETAFFGERAERVPDDLGFEARLERAHHPFP